MDKYSDFVLNPDLQVPESTMEMAAVLLVDTLGVCAGAADMDAGRIARQMAIDFHGASTSSHAAPILFDGRTVSLPGAAYAAATQIDNLDAHDGYNPTRGHIGCAVIPALFAFASQIPELTGRQALMALVMSYEFSARAAFALHGSVSDYHTSGAWNALGVAALGSHLRGHNPETLRQALGIAEYHGPRSQMMREIANPTMLHDGSGMGALTGVSATLLAERGFLGAPAITVEADDVAAHWADLGQLWTIELNYIKPYPICRWAHAAIDAADTLVKTHDLHVDQISSVHINTFKESACLFPGVPGTTSEAQYSLAFAVAVQLKHGHIGPEEVSGPVLADPEIAAIVDRISVSEEPRHSVRFPDGRWSDMTITLKDGRTLASGDVNARGGPEAPMELPEIKSKFFAMAEPRLGASRSQAIWSTTQSLTKESVLFSDLTKLVEGPTV
ncbi:MAG: MmgE/PrpD family protein [Paracoccaceae bacterium]